MLSLMVMRITQILSLDPKRVFMVVKPVKRQADFSKTAERAEFTAEGHLHVEDETEGSGLVIIVYTRSDGFSLILSKW